MPCRINRQALWGARIYLESGCHAASCFVTLTYARFEVPWELEPDDLQEFLKRLRKVSGLKLRYYAAGEYGTRTGRPHLHVALFGLSMIQHELITRCWPFGSVHVGELNTKTAKYVAKYITKKWIGDSVDPRNGLRAEFSRMSLRPGIGAAAMEATVASLLSDGGSRALASSVDVPRSVRIEGRRRPLGKYLRSRLREGVGWDSGATPDAQRAAALREQNVPLKEQEALRRASAEKARSVFDIAESKRRL